MASHESSYNPNNAVEKWIDDRLPVIRFAKEHLMDFPTPKNLNYWWTGGAILAVMLVVQIITGIVLAMHYTPNVLMAFDSVEHIRRDVNGGRIIQATHAVGASMFFAAVYVHIFRGLYFGSYKAPREILWILGVLIFILMMATAFMGYVLPWGQMSFWAATVITNIFQAIPIVGDPILQLLRGGFVVDNATLNRFFSLHYLLPFVIAAVVALHIWALHVPGNNNPIGVEVKSSRDTVPFHPYYTMKDLFAIVVFFIPFAWFVFFAPDILGHADNYIMANSQVTPTHIVPEWYFLPFYAILKSFTADFILTGKLWGVLAMFGSILLLFFLPWLDSSPVRSANYRPTYRWFLIVLAIDVLVLGYVGGAEANARNVIIGQIATAYYFAHFLIILPIVSRSERPRPLPNSITEAVLAKHGGTSPAQTALAH